MNKKLIKEHFADIEKNINKELGEIEAILKGSELEHIKLESIKSILLKMAAEIQDARIEKFYEDRTGLLSSRVGEDFVEKEIENSLRYGQKFSIALLDIDFLKYINDKYGHVPGTKAIIDVAESIKKILRKSDVASRYGGDEFLIIFTNTPIEKAENAVLRIKASIDELNKKSKIKISFSVGLAQFEGTNEESAAQLIDRADKELYISKKSRLNLNL